MKKQETQHNPPTDLKDDGLVHGADPRDVFTHRQIMTILTGLMLGMFLGALDQTIVATSIRTIADDLKGLDHQAWATTAYLITSTIVTPLYGKLSDIYGRKKFFVTAISVFIIGSMLCTLAHSMLQLSLYRAVQGLGAGGLFSLALAIVGDIVPPRERAKYQGYFLAVFGTSSVLGPVVGGFLAGQSSILGITGWRWVFLVNVPVGIIALAVVAKTLHLHHHRLDHRIDWLGAILLSVGLVPLLIVAEQGREWGWDSKNAITCYIVGVIGLIIYLAQEWRMGEEALFPLRMFTNKTVGVASTAGVIIGVAMFGGIACLPLYLQIVRGATPTQAGLMLLPLTGGIMFGSILSGQLISRTGRYRKFPIMGAFLLCGSLFAFHYVHEDTPLWQTMIVMVFFGVGLGFNFQPLTLAVQNAVPRHQMGVATSTATFTRQIGGTIGTAVFLSILFTTLPEKIKAAMDAAVKTPAFQQALHDPKNAEFARQMAASKQSGGQAGGNVLQDSSFLNNLDPRLAKPFLQGFAESMDLVFLWGSAVMILGVIVILLLPHVELRSGHGPGPGDAQPSAPDTAAEVSTKNPSGVNGSTDVNADSQHRPSRTTAVPVNTHSAHGRGEGPAGSPA